MRSESVFHKPVEQTLTLLLSWFMKKTKIRPRTGMGRVGRLLYFIINIYIYFFFNAIQFNSLVSVRLMVFFLLIVLFIKHAINQVSIKTLKICFYFNFVFTKIWSSTTVFITDNDKSSELAYYSDFWRSCDWSNDAESALHHCKKIYFKIYAYKWQNQTIVNGNVTLIYKNKYIFIKKDYVEDL